MKSIVFTFSLPLAPVFFGGWSSFTAFKVTPQKQQGVICSQLPLTAYNELCIGPLLPQTFSECRRVNTNMFSNNGTKLPPLNLFHWDSLPNDDDVIFLGSMNNPAIIQQVSTPDYHHIQNEFNFFPGNYHQDWSSSSCSDSTVVSNWYFGQFLGQFLISLHF